ncbi:MAG: hypothetical protein DCO96_11255 [Fluviicola sp. XM-24bin1]|nr:MAG: hypothetical protein DCO96_11255 [Fluviicola sp. XM-24bin1]
MADKKKDTKLKQILMDLATDDSKKISKAIKALEAHGDPSVIKPLSEKLLSGVSEKNQKEILELFSSFKDSNVTAEMMDVIEDEHFLPIRQLLLSTIWNTKVDFSDYIDEFVQIAVDGDFMETLDCLTIIENLEGPFMEENILEAQLHLKNYLEQSGDKDEQKAQLLSEIALLLKDINRNLQD